MKKNLGIGIILLCILLTVICLLGCTDTQNEGILVPNSGVLPGSDDRNVGGELNNTGDEQNNSGVLPGSDNRNVGGELNNTGDEQNSGDEVFYTVTFYLNDGTTISNASRKVILPANTISSLPPTPMRIGYSFSSWNTKDDGSGDEFNANTNITSDIKVYAQWVESANYWGRNLFDAYAQNKLPFANGYIISSFSSENSSNYVYEIVTYAGVKELFPSAEGLQFISGGKKLYILVETNEFIEPVSRSRSDGEQIPKRFSELNRIITENQTTISVAKEPDEIQGSFTIQKPTTNNFAVIFYSHSDVFDSIELFFISSFIQRGIPETSAIEAAQLIKQTIEKTMVWSEFE